MRNLVIARRRLPVVVAVLLVPVVVALAGCGGGGETSAPGRATDGAVAKSLIAEKLGLTAAGNGEYRLGGCTAKAVFGSPAAIQGARTAGKRVVTDPTGSYGIEIEPNARCARVMGQAVAILNVP
jgi:hypothetical protein